MTRVPQWFYFLHNDPRCRFPGGWCEYDMNMNQATEQLYQQNLTPNLSSNPGRHLVPLLATNGCRYELDFQRMTQRNNRSGKERPIERTTNGLMPTTVPPRVTPDAHATTTTFRHNIGDASTSNLQKVLLPASQEQAHEELQLILSSKAWRYQNEFSSASGILYRFLGILEAYPELAKARYNSGHITRATPLLCLCCVRACTTIVPMKVIQTVYDLYPSAAKELHGGRQYTPLALACLLRAPGQVIKFLLDKNPQAKFVKNFDGFYPVEAVVRAPNWWVHQFGMPLTLELCPGEHTRDLRFGPCKQPLLEEALVCGFSAADLLLLAEKFPPESFTVPASASLGEEQCQLLRFLLPRLKSLAVHTQLCSHEAIDEVVTSLAGNQSVTQLGKLVLNRRMLPVWNRHLERILKTNTAIEILQLEVPGTVRAPTDIHLDGAIVDGLCHDQTLRELELDGFDDVRRRGTNGVWTASSHSVVRKLVLKKCRFSIDILKPLLEIFPQLEELELESVRIGGGDDAEATRFIVMALEHPTLTSLFVKCCPWCSYDVSQICQALKQNTSLLHYSVESSFDTVAKNKILMDALEVNTTLERIDPCCFKVGVMKSIRPRRTAHLLRLNGCGRGEIRRHDTGLARFVELLAALKMEQKDDNDDDDDDDKQHLAFQLLNGLLQEGIHHWAVSM
ncbi:expressed unknown protein [Seminavis robusta]|uniref:WWE domain-containing protein n=1 Tax=Seminavis robusta TaxID=568900 RepID=A0A9N8HLZ5_9STRA|nr:expressed unknown protein [Seminavis robusta]|eukprot:Sro711_g191270.1 n/a (679) ;mRNA; r:47730-49766